MPEAEFRGCLSAAFAEDSMPLAEEEEERLLLLADKTAAGEVHWRPFLVAYAGGKEADLASTTGDASAWQWRPQPASPKRTPVQQQRFDRTDPNVSAQSWRAGKTAPRAMSTAVLSGSTTPTVERSIQETQAKGLCPCRRRCGK
mmetsp:Transcript_107449/g.334958  ORF Transcript_107449/g.334958 Transcript_107449/m.334958 type:complete len:144 (+) Transcript_107449:50-481(+)